MQATGPGQSPVVSVGNTFLWFGLDSKGTASTADDSYVLSTFASPSQTANATFSSLQTGFDGFSSVRFGQSNWSTSVQDTVSLTIFEFPSVLGGGLDFIQLARLTGSVTPSGTGVQYAVIGNVGSGFLSPAVGLQTSGSATYRGETRGTYIDTAGQALDTVSSIQLLANFSSQSISGSASNFWGRDSSGGTVKLTDSLNLTFNGSISMRSGPTLTSAPGVAGTVSNSTMTGTFEGFFYGQSGGLPVELGIGYAVTGPNGSTMFGVGGLATSPSDLAD